ncbi:MAG: serine hydrolase, partial [Rhodospirillaceae bacterium]|nr:serine hydrolase [Rhodospirillaceae bacterium]
MTSDLSPHLIRNPDLDVDHDNLGMWNRAHTRRHGFRNLHRLHRMGLTARSSQVLPLRTRIERWIGDLPEVRRLTGSTIFCGMVVAKGRDLLFETYADDFGPDMPHSIQSITKTNLNLIYGRLLADGLVDLEKPVEFYIPEIGSGYRGRTVQQVLDMNVMNNFDEDYAAPYDPPPAPGERWGYGQEEVAMNWRLPPPGQAHYGVRDLAVRLEDDGTTNPDNIMHYKSANTDLAGWIAERVSGRDLKAWFIDNVEAAGLEGCFHISLDKDFVPVFSGGGLLTTRDLARWGLLFARGGIGVDGTPAGDPAFIETTRNNRGTFIIGPRSDQRYSNQMFTNGTWVGHGGYGGQ